jgi:phosphocarrier protein
MLFAGKTTKARRTLVIENKLGMHARPAALFVRTATAYKSAVTVTKGGTVIDGKSILSLLTLAAPAGSTLVVNAHGDDAEEAVNALEKLVREKFGEE